MLFPSKFTRLEESTLFKLRCIIEEKKENEKVIDAFHRTKHVFFDASEFLYALDILYVLDLIDLDFPLETLNYA